MNKDFRVSVALANHPKTLKLMRRCGDISFYNLIKFWSYVAQNKPDGNLKNIDADDIEIASGWNGQCSILYQALLDLRFIEKTNEGHRVHDWSEHNGYACHALDRSDKAKMAAERRWGKRNNATSMPQAMLGDATSNAPSPSPSPDPTPTPDPSLKERKKLFVADSAEIRLANFLFAHIRKNNPLAKQPDVQKWAYDFDLMIRRDSRAVDDIKCVIEWCQKDEFWKSNILSPKKLRDKYDQLFVKMNSHKECDKEGWI